VLKVPRVSAAAGACSEAVKKAYDDAKDVLQSELNCLGKAMRAQARSGRHNIVDFRGQAFFTSEPPASSRLFNMILVFERCDHSLEAEVNNRTNAGQQQLSRHEGASWVLQLCAGMLDTHSVNVIHRDIAQRNVLVVESKAGLVLKLADFGISKVLGVSRQTTTNIKDSGGTATELIAAIYKGQTLPYSLEVDIFSLGFLCAQLLMLAPVPPRNRYPDGYLKQLLKGVKQHHGEAMHSLIASMVHERPECRPSAEACFKEASRLQDLLQPSQSQESKVSASSLHAIFMRCAWEAGRRKATFG
jgi:serine/threonine protein kinase